MTDNKKLREADRPFGGAAAPDGRSFVFLVVLFMTLSVRGPQFENYRIIIRGNSVYNSGGAYGGILYVLKRGYGSVKCVVLQRKHWSSYNFLIRYAVWTGK
jgi:hypothetical protein